MRCRLPSSSFLLVWSAHVHSVHCDQRPSYSFSGCKKSSRPVSWTHRQLLISLSHFSSYGTMQNLTYLNVSSHATGCPGNAFSAVGLSCRRLAASRSPPVSRQGTSFKICPPLCELMLPGRSAPQWEHWSLAGQNLWPRNSGKNTDHKAQARSHKAPDSSTKSVQGAAGKI